MDLQLTLSVNSKVNTEHTMSVSKLGVCATGIASHGVGKIGPHGPLPLAQSAAHSMGITKFFLALQSFCCRLSVVLLSYDSRSTLIRRDRTEKFGRTYIHTYIPSAVQIFSCDTVLLE